MYAAVLVITTGVATGAQAGPWSEYGVADPLRSAQQLVEASCDLSVELHGAIVDVSVRQRVTNPGPASYASVTEFFLPEGAQLIGMTLQRGGKGPVVDEDHAFVVLSRTGTVAASRRSMIAGGGPYTRMLDLDDPKFPSVSRRQSLRRLNTHERPIPSSCSS